MKWIVLALVVVSATTVFAKSCKTAEDCEEGECCVNYLIVSFFGGHCQKLRQEGESCTPLVKNTEEKPDMYHFQCPCKEGLDCVPKYEIKIGEHTIRHRPECVVPGEKEVTEETPFPDPDLE